jgi:hypothetical protein
MSVQKDESESQFWRFVWYWERSLVRWPSPTMKRAPRVGRVPSPSYKPRRNSRRLARAWPVFVLTADDASLSTHVSPLDTS